MMTRREFILSTAAATALGPRFPAYASEKIASIPAIDTHTHFYDPTRPEGVPWPPKDNPLLHIPRYPKDFRAEASPHNVVGTVVVEASDWVEDNAWILELAETNDDIVGLIGNLEPGKPEFAGHLKRFSANPLFLGLRLRGAINNHLGEDRVLADIKRLADLDQTLDIHGGARMLAPTLMIAGKFPSLRIVVNHLPFGDWDGNVPEMRGALAELTRHPNVYMKVSAVVRRLKGEVVVDPEFYRPGLDALYELFGPDRLVYGSNWPVSDQIAPYTNVRGVVNDYFATRSRSDAEKYFWRNSLVAYRWIPRGAAAKLVR